MRMPLSILQIEFISPTPANAGQAPQNFVQELKFYNLALFAVLLMILAPIWIVKYPGVADYPNHLARCYILAHYHEDLIWQQRYLLDYTPLPNLAIDLIVTPLLRILPLLVAGKVFLSIAAILYVVGCSAVGRAVIGKPNWLALACAFTFYNSTLLSGFVNYIFGIGVFLCAFAYWLRVRDRMTFVRFVLCCLLSIAAFLAHMSSVVILGVACCTIAILDFVQDRKILGSIVKLIWLGCPVLLMVGFMKGSGRVGGIIWRSPLGKLTTLLAPIRSYNAVLDTATLVVLLVCALVLLRRGKVHLAVVASFVLFVLYLITPATLFTASGVDLRYVVPGFLLLALSIEPIWGRSKKAALAVALAAMMIHTWSISAKWLSMSNRSADVLAMGEVLPAGARIYAVIPSLNGATNPDPGFINVIQLWTATHKAEVSTLFALPGQQPLVFRQMPCFGPDYGNPEWKKCLASYDYIWTYDPPPALRQDILSFATPANVWEKVTLWRVSRTPNP